MTGGYSSASSATPQAKTLALLPKFTGFFSLCGSAFIFQDITCHGTTATTKRRVFHRVMLGLSISDAVASVVNILSTWPIPEGTPGVYLARGTTQTCTAQGFFNEMGNVATPLYNASLCVYFVRKIRDGWTEDEIQNRNEKIMHSVPALVATTISVLGLVFDLYNNSGWLCWFAQNPPGCVDNSDVECIRGQLAEPFRWTHYTIIWSTICFIGYEMYAIYRFVKVQERIQYADSLNEEGRHRGTKAKRVAIQAGLFVGALYLTWFFTTVSRIYQNITGHNNFVLQLLMAIFFPLQGFFNSLIYIRPRYLRARSRNPNFSAKQLFHIALHHDGHPLHQTTTRPVTQQTRHDQRAPWQQRRQSPAASDYPIGPMRQYGQSTDGESINEDGLYSVADTVNAKADESEFQNRSSFKKTANASVAKPQADDGFPNEDSSSKDEGVTTRASDTRSHADHDGASNPDSTSKSAENTSSASATTSLAGEEADVSSKSDEQFLDNPT